VTTDHQHDWDIVVGTQTAGVNDLPIWFEGFPDRYTGDRLYRASANYSGLSPRNIFAIASGNIDQSSADYTDIVTAVGINETSGGFEVWPNQALVREGYVGIGFPVTAPYAFFSISGSTGAGRSIDLADFDGDNDLDVVLGTRTGNNAGHIEVWTNNGFGIYTRSRQHSASGEVLAVVAADFNGDGRPDIATGTKTHNNDTQGIIEVWLNTGGNYNRLGAWEAGGKVNAIAAGQMDADGDIDIVVGTKTGNNDGAVELWLNDGTGEMSLGDFAAADHVVLSLALGEIDPDRSLDIVAGTGARSVQSWFCDPDAERATDIIPALESWADANTGGVVNAISIRKVEASRDRPGDDPLNDVICGTAISATSGEIVIYLNPFVWVYNP